MLIDQQERRAFLEAYAGREFGQSIRLLAARQGINRDILQRWLADERFRNQLFDLDLARIAGAREVGMRYVEAITANMCNLALGSTKASVAAAKVILQVTGLIATGGNVTINQALVNQFGGARGDDEEMTPE